MKATPGRREGLPSLVAVSPARPADDATSVSISRMYSSPCPSRTIFAARQSREIQATGLVDPPPGVTPMRHRNVRPDWTCRGPPHGPVEQMQPARRLTTRILNFIQSGQSIYSFPKLGNGYSESRSNWQRYAAAAQHANGGVNPVQLYVCVGLGFNSRRSNRATAGSVAHGGDAVVHISSDCQRRHDRDQGIAPIEEPGKHRQRHPRRGVNAPWPDAALLTQRKFPAEKEVLRCDGSPRSERQHNEAGQVGK